MFLLVSSLHVLVVMSKRFPISFFCLFPPTWPPELCQLNFCPTPLSDKGLGYPWGSLGRYDAYQGGGGGTSPRTGHIRECSPPRVPGWNLNPGPSVLLASPMLATGILKMGVKLISIIFQKMSVLNIKLFSTSMQILHVNTKQCSQRWH